MSRNYIAMIIGLITIIIYVLTVSPVYKPAVASFFALYLLVSVFGFVFLGIFYQKQKRSLVIKISFLISMVMILLWVGITGWFFSPFYYLLFLLAICLSFFFSLTASTIFIIILSIIYLPNVGSIDLMLDIIMLMSLYLVIPISFFIEKEYLRLRESDKQVVILEEKTKKLVIEIKKALESVNSFGSVEIYVQKGVVTQITVRNIKKTGNRQ